MNETVDSLEIEISASSGDAAEKVNRLATALGNLKNALKGGVGGLGNVAKQLQGLSSAAASASQSTSSIERLVNSLQKLSGVSVPTDLATNIRAVTGALGSVNRNTKGLDNLISSLERLSRVDTSALTALGNITAPRIPKNFGDAITSMANAIEKIPADTVQRLNSIADALRQLGDVNLKGIRDTLNQLGRQKVKLKIDSSQADRASSKVGILATGLRALGRIAVYRVLRGIIKSIGEAFAEGAENAYWYSKTIGDSTKYIADAYDQVASKSSTMKNQLGAAWATLRAAITPVLLEIIHFATLAANAITMLFAALGGRGTYLKANDVIKDAYENTAKGAAAAKEWKNQLMGFDEINRLEEPSSGGGGGGAGGLDYSELFHEEEVSGWAKTVAEHFKEIATLAGLVGAGILTWAKSAGLVDPKLAKTVGTILAGVGAVMLVKNGIDAWKTSLNDSNLLGMLEGAALLAGGLALAFGKVGGAIGLIVGSVALLTVGFKEWIETGKLTEQSFYAIEAGIIALGAGIALVTGSWIPLAIAAVAGLVLAIYKNWDGVKEFFANLWTNIKAGAVKFWNSVVSFYTEKIPEAIEKIVGWFGELPEKVGYVIGLMFGTVVKWLTDLGIAVAVSVPHIVEAIVKFFRELPGKIHTALLVFITDTLPRWANGIQNWVTTTLPNVINSIISWFANLPTAMVNIGRDMLVGLWNGIVSVADWLGGNISAFLNNLFGGFGRGFVSGTTSIFGGGFASGGFPNSGQLFLAREAGPELVGTMNGQNAVANNQEITEGIYRAAYQAFTDAMSGGGNDRDVHIYLDGREIATSTTRYQRQFARANG